MIKWEYRLLNEGELRDQRVETNIFISGFGAEQRKGLQMCFLKNLVGFLGN